jgi:hypothetical protein
MGYCRERCRGWSGAKVLGLTIPESFLLRTGAVIE